MGRLSPPAHTPQCVSAHHSHTCLKHDLSLKKETQSRWKWWNAMKKCHQWKVCDMQTAGWCQSGHHRQVWGCVFLTDSPGRSPYRPRPGRHRSCCWWLFRIRRYTESWTRWERSPPAASEGKEGKLREKRDVKNTHQWRVASSPWTHTGVYFDSITRTYTSCPKSHLSTKYELMCCIYFPTSVLFPPVVSDLFVGFVDKKRNTE